MNSVLRWLGMIALVMATEASASPYVLGYAGGSGGAWFWDLPANKADRIFGFRVREGAKGDAITLVYQRPDGSWYEGPPHGGWGGSEQLILMQPNEYVTAIDVQVEDDVVAFMNIITSTGWQYNVGGYNGQVPLIGFRLPPGHRLRGLSGRSGALLDQVVLLVEPNRCVPYWAIPFEPRP